MTKTLLNVRTDPEVKKEAKQIAKELGVPLSTVVNSYLKEFIRNKELHLTFTPQVRPEIAKMLKQASRDYKKRKGVDGPFKTAKEVTDYLHS